MTRHHMTVDGLVPFTQDEEDFRDLEEASSLAEKPMRNWKASMQETDRGMPRYLEDHITDDHDGVASNEFLQVKYDAKIKLRATKP